MSVLDMSANGQWRRLPPRAGHWLGRVKAAVVSEWRLRRQVAFLLEQNDRHAARPRALPERCGARRSPRAPRLSGRDCQGGGCWLSLAPCQLRPLSHSRRAVVALGANLGDRRATLDQAVTLMAAELGEVVARSAWLATPAMIHPDDPAKSYPEFLNGAVLLRTACPRRRSWPGCIASRPSSGGTGARRPRAGGRG